MNNILETDDQLLGYGELILNAHEIVDMIHVDQKDWLRRRQYLIEYWPSWPWPRSASPSRSRPSSPTG